MEFRCGNSSDTRACDGYGFSMSFGLGVNNSLIKEHFDMWGGISSSFLMYSSRLALRALDIVSVTKVTGPGIKGSVRAAGLFWPASSGNVFKSVIWQS